LKAVKNILGSLSEMVGEIFDRSLVVSVLLIIVLFTIIMLSLPYLPYPT
jgi:hypothetical protein